MNVRAILTGVVVLSTALCASLPVSAKSVPHHITPSVTPAGHWVAGIVPQIRQQLGIHTPATSTTSRTQPQYIVSPSGGSCPPNTTYSGANAKYSCMATVPDGSGHVVWIRQGYNTSAGKGFGYEHFYNKHNVWLSTVSNDIQNNQSGIYQSKTGRYLYGEYYVGSNGQVDQQVLAFESRNSAPVGNEMGIITAYCQTGSGGYEAKCPNWVNTSQ